MKNYQKYEKSNNMKNCKKYNKKYVKFEKVSTKKIGS